MGSAYWGEKVKKDIFLKKVRNSFVHITATIILKFYIWMMKGVSGVVIITIHPLRSPSLSCFLTHLMMPLGSISFI